MRPNWEVGFYSPFAVAGTGEFLSDGAKIRNLFVVPDAGKRNFFYGVNFELGYELPPFALSQSPWGLEIRPIIGVRNKEWEFIVNPIVDLSFGRGGEADFAPAVRLARNLGEDRFIGLEYYSDYGKIGNILPLQQQYQELYAVADFKVKDVDVELGAGYGFTPGSDRLIFKAILGYAFPVPGKNKDDSGGSNSSMTMGTQPRPQKSFLGEIAVPRFLRIADWRASMRALRMRVAGRRIFRAILWQAARRCMRKSVMGNALRCEKASEVNVRHGKALAGLIAAAVLLSGSAQAGEKEKEKEAPAELEIGAAAEWAIPGGDVGFGPSVGIEYTLLKDWLEVELEVSPLFGAGRTDWDTEFIFKKPFELSDKLEVMPGIGPAWLYTTSHGQSTSSLGAVALVDIQIWPSPERKYGWFIEPSYTYDFSREHEQSLGVTFGLLIPIR